MKSIWIGILFLAVNVSSQELLKCYVCMWNQDSGDGSNQDCIDNLTPALLTQCPDPPIGSKNACTVSKIYEKSNKMELSHIMRECQYIAIDGYEEGCEKTVIDNIEFETCICDEDECNDNRGPSPSTEETSTVLIDSSTPQKEELSCYECFWREGDTDSDENCLISPSDAYLMTCSEPPTDYVKHACGLAKGFEKGTKNVIILERAGCRYLTNDEYEELEGCRDSEEVVDGVEIDVETCYCDEDKCNDSPGQSSSASIQKMALIIPILSNFISFLK